jgi:hypothetical protein
MYFMRTIVSPTQTLPVSHANGTSLCSKRLLTGAVAFPLPLCAIDLKAVELTLAKEERTAGAVVVGKLDVGPEGVNAVDCREHIGWNGRSFEDERLS